MNKIKLFLAINRGVPYFAENAILKLCRSSYSSNVILLCFMFLGKILNIKT